MSRIFRGLILLITLSPYKPTQFCEPPTHETLNVEGCHCLTYHPKAEFCYDKTAMLPGCCAVYENKHLEGCHCCAKVPGAVVEYKLK